MFLSRKRFVICTILSLVDFWKNSIKGIIQNEFLTNINNAEVKTFTEHELYEMAQKIHRNRSRTPDVMKGENGVVGVIGGSVEFSGSPIFVSSAAVKTGSDIAYIFCPIIETYTLKLNPIEMIVFPFLDVDGGKEIIIRKIKNIDSLIIGPGIGREGRHSIEIINYIIEYLVVHKELHSLSLIFGEDGLNLLIENANNVAEYTGTIYVVADCNSIKKLGLAYLKDEEIDADNNEILRELIKKINTNAVLILMDKKDKIINAFECYTCSFQRAPHGCIGEEIILLGALGTFSYWGQLYKKKVNQIPVSIEILASYAASAITRMSCQQSYFLDWKEININDMLSVLRHVQEQFFPDYSVCKCDKLSKESDSSEF